MPQKVSRVDGDVGESTVQLELEGFTPSTSDVDGIAVLLKQLFQASLAKEISDYIVEHNSYATVVKPFEGSEDESDDDSDQQDVVLSLTTVINLSLVEAEKFNCIKHLREFLVDVVSGAPSCAEKERILAYFSPSTSSRLFLFLNERFSSFPLSICADAVAGLPEELKEAALEPTDLLLLVKAHRSDEEIEYAYPELEEIIPFATTHMEVCNKLAAPEEDFNSFVLAIVPMNRFSQVLDKLRPAL